MSDKHLLELRLLEEIQVGERKISTIVPLPVFWN